MKCFRVYHTKDRENYKIIISKKELKKAFSSPEEYVKLFYKMYKVSKGKVVPLELVQQVAEENGVWLGGIIK